MTLRRSLGSWLSALSTCAVVASAAHAATDAAQRWPDAKVLASISPEPGHLIEFGELPSGALSVSESASIFQTPLLRHSVFGKSMTDIYRMIRPHENVPEALVAAEGRLAVLKPKPELGRKPPTPHLHGTGKGPKLLNAGEQAWFKKTLCHDAGTSLSLVNCIQGYEWVHSGAHQSVIFSSESMVGLEGVTAEVRTFWFDGSNWSLLSNHTVKPGTYRWDYVTYNQPFLWYVNLDGAGVNTLVSQDVKACGNGGQWSCYPNCGGCNPETSSDCEEVGLAGLSICDPIDQ